jgi:hypothetical protein
MKKRFIVEIEVPTDTGNLCWDRDEIGLQVFHECITAVLPQISLRDRINVVDENDDYRNFIERQCMVRDSFKVINPIIDD